MLAKKCTLFIVLITLVAVFIPVSTYATDNKIVIDKIDLTDYQVDYDVLYGMALNGEKEYSGSKYTHQTTAYLKNNNTNEEYDIEVHSTSKLIDEFIINGKEAKIYVAASFARLNWDFFQGQNDWDKTGGISHTSVVYFATSYDVATGVTLFKPIYMTGQYTNFDYPQVSISDRKQRFSQAGLEIVGNSFVLFSDTTNWSYCSNSYTKYAPSWWPYIMYVGYYMAGSEHMATLTHISGSSWTFYSKNEIFQFEW